MAFSRWSTAVTNRQLDKLLGAGADTTVLGVSTVYVELDTTAPSDVNGTGIVASSLGRVAVPVVDGTMWPAASARVKTNGSTITFAQNTTGSTISCVYVSLWTAATAGTFLGGDVPDSSPVAIPNGSTPTISPSGLTVNAPGT